VQHAALSNTLHLEVIRNVKTFLLMLLLLFASMALQQLVVSAGLVSNPATAAGIAVAKVSKVRSFKLDYSLLSERITYSCADNT
jgi:hypothetical protein